MFNSNYSSDEVFNKPFFIFLIGLILTLMIWFLLGYGPEFFVGTNDISHHLLTLRISNNSFPHFTPIYDWLWMGGQLVAPNVGHVPLERLFMSLGLNEGFALSLTVFIFHATLFSFTFDLFKQKEYFSKLENLLLAISLAFLPTTMTRIFFGHTSLYFPISFLFFLIWILNTNRFSWFLFAWGIVFGLITLSGPSFQLVFYFVFFVFPLLYFFNRVQFKERWKIFFLAILIPVFFSLDFLFLVYNYIFSGNDLFRKTDDTFLLYSYAKLNFKHLLDFFTLKIVNLNNDNYFLFHETKYFLGLPTLVFIIKEHGWRKNIFLILFLFMIMVFIIPPTDSINHFFSSIPGLNLFRIPQRVFLLLSPLLIFYSFYQYKPNHFKEKTYTWFVLLLLIGASFWQNPLWLDLVMVVLSFFVVFNWLPVFSFRQYLIFQLFAFLLYSFQFHTRVTSDSLLSFDKNIKERMTRAETYNSLGWHLNTNRVYNINSVFGYTHPLPPYRSLFQEISGQYVVDQLVFSPGLISPPNLLSGFLSLYRYEKNILSYSPTFITKDKKSFLTSVGAGQFDPINLTLLTSPNIRVCPKPITIISEKIIDGFLEIELINPNQFKCLVVVPYNYSNFLKAQTSFTSSVQLFPVNLSQIGFLAPLDKSEIRIGPDYSFYWKIKLIGFFVGVALICFSFCFKRHLNINF